MSHEKIEIIESKDNRFIKRYKKTVLSKKTRTTEEIFAAEGKRLVFDALENKIEPEFILLSENAEQKYGDEIRKFGTDYYVISEKLANEIAETKTTQGVFGLFKKPKDCDKNDLLNLGEKFLVLVSLQDPGNMGTILRTCDAFGIDGIITSNCPEIFSPKVVRSAMGSVFRVKTAEFENAEDIPKVLREHKIKSYAAVLAKDSVSADKVNFSGKTAVFIGNEGNGLPANISKKCDAKIILPMRGGAESLNAAMAAGIFMWEMAKSREDRHDR